MGEEEDVEEYYIDADGKEVAAPKQFEPTTPAVFDEETSDAVQQVLKNLDDNEKAFMKGLGNDFLEQMAEESIQSNEGAQGGRNRTVTQEENDEALKLAMEQYAKLTIPWQKDALIKKTKKTLAKKKADLKKKKNPGQKKNGTKKKKKKKKKSQEEYNALKKKQEEIAA